jgi:hypothetical protein
MKPIIKILTDFNNKVDIIKPIGGAKNQIRHEFFYLKRVWNDGHGLLCFAQKHEADNVLLINEMLCTKKEINTIKNELNVPHEFVFLGYPDYYNNGLISIRQKNKLKEIQNLLEKGK